MANENLDLIRRSVLLARYDRIHVGEPGKARKLIEDAPTVDAVPVVHGRWEKEDQSGISIDGYMVCSACDVMIPKPDYNRYCLHRLNFCPHCGSPMDGGDGDGSA